MTDREEEIRKAVDRFVTAVIWKIFGPPIIALCGLALGFLGMAALSII